MYRSREVSLREEIDDDDAPVRLLVHLRRPRTFRNRKVKLNLSNRALGLLFFLTLPNLVDDEAWKHLFLYL
jgi:hypothetical protein